MFKNDLSMVVSLNFHITHLSQQAIIGIVKILKYDIEQKIQAGLTTREVKFKEWDPDIVKEEEGVDGDNHDQVNLAAQEMSKFIIYAENTPTPLKFHTSHIFFSKVSQGRLKLIIII